MTSQPAAPNARIARAARSPEFISTVWHRPLAAACRTA
jgi:hypothetical protein